MARPPRISSNSLPIFFIRSPRSTTARWSAAMLRRALVAEKIGHVQQVHVQRRGFRSIRRNTAALRNDGFRAGTTSSRAFSSAWQELIW